MNAWLAGLVVAVLPGAVFYRAPIWNRPARAALSAEERWFWCVMLSVAWSLAAVLALGVIGWYSLPRLVAINTTITLVMAAAWRTRLVYRPNEAARLSASAILPAGLIALGLWLFFPQAEYIAGGKDPGVYLNEGAQIARRGALVVRDPDVASVPVLGSTVRPTTSL